MRFLRFQPKFRHAVSHYQYSKFYPKLPKTAKKLAKSAQRRNFEIPPKIEILVSLKTKNCTYRGGTRACFHRSDFQSKNFPYAIFIVKKQTQHTPLWKLMIFS
jgi:hypothetical protein